MVAALLTCAVLVSACMWLHFLVMRRLWVMINGKRKVRRPLLKILLILFGLHLFDVLLYAVALSLHELAGYGRLAGDVGHASNWFADHLYFSIASYTTLGIGDIVPRGSLRLISGVEALNGLILIALTASFTYLVMEKFWGEQHFGRSGDDPNRDQD